MNVKQFIVPIIIFLIGFIFIILGALFKIIHYQIGAITGNYLLSIGSVLKVIALIIAIIKLLSIYNSKDN